MSDSFVIDHQQSFVIRCSFCDAVERVDIPIGEQQARGMTHETIKGKVSRIALDKGWKYLVTVHGVTLNYCPDDKYKLD